MAMALAVVIVACEAAAGKPGEPGEPGAPGAPGETPKLAPVIRVPFEPVALMVEGDTAGPIDVSAHFYDPEGEALTYAIDVDPAEGVVTTALAEGILTITPVAEGVATITVTATDPDSKSTSASIKVTVAPEGMMPPVTVGTIDAVSLDVGNTHAIQDISQYFSEPEEEMLTYSAAVVPALIATAMLDGTTLTVRGDAYGTATVTVTATDEDDLSVSQEITVTVAVPVPPKPDPMPDAPMAEGTIDDQEVEVDESLAAMDISMYFTPTTGLTYKAVSAAPDKASATLPTGSSSLTIAGVAIGSASVTVTATDSDGRTATQTFTVTVTAAMAPHKPPTVTLDGVNDTEDVSIDAGETLQPIDPDIVSAARKDGSATVWTLTGKKKGTTVVRILDSDRTIDGTIDVTVENSKPVVVEAEVPTTIQQLVAAATIDPAEIVDAKGAPVVVAPGKRGYHRLLVDFGDIFNDLDGDIKDYEAISHEPYVEVVHKTATFVVLDVRKKVGTSFPLEVYVVDEDGLMSDKVMLSVETVTPIGDIYEVVQHLSPTSLVVKGGKVYQREGVDHELRFLEYETNSEGFRFVSEYRAGHVATLIGADATSTSHDSLTTKSTDDPLTATTTAHYTLTKTGNLDGLMLSLTEALGADTTDNDPGLTFQVTSGGRGTVTFTYNAVVAENDGSDAAVAGSWAFDKTPPTATVEMNIVSES